MNWDSIEGQWEHLVGSAKERWPMLADGDLKYIEGRRERLCGILQERYGRAHTEAEQMIDDWAKTLCQPAVR